MAKFTKIPQVVDAEQWTGSNMAKIEKLVGADRVIIDNAGLILKLQHTDVFVTRGHFIVVEGKESYPIILSEFKFNLTYSPKKK